MPELHDPRDPLSPRTPRVPSIPSSSDAPEDVLTSALKDAAAAGQTAASPAPLTVIMARGDRMRRRRTVGYAVAACLAVGGTGAAVAAVLPLGGGAVAPATSPSGSNPDRGRDTVPSPRLSTPGSTQLGPASGTPTGIRTGGPGASETDHGPATHAPTTTETAGSGPGGPPAAATTSAPPPDSTLRTTAPPG
ncbi:hypothetical protein ABZ721_15905 [Streptomyces sp. NPDC006733]|uniref:hypothetical protein n=1 Tax=Streptomyces sp. NPDC006733 TaxID=3155460 RepID=UPI0033FE1334